MVPTLQALSMVFALALPGSEADVPPYPQTGALAGPESPFRSDEARVVAGCLRTSRSNPSAAAELAVRIATSGPRALEAVFGVLVERRIEPVQPDDALQVLSVPQRALLLDALRRLPPESVRAYVTAQLRAAQPDDDGVHLAVVHALGAVGKASDLQKLVALAPRKQGDADGSWTRDARAAVKLAVESILARDPRAWVELPGIVRTTDHVAARTLLDALGARRDPRALAVLFESLHAHPGLAPLAVATSSKVGPSLDGEITRGFVDWMTNQLVVARREHGQGLLQAIGSLDDGSHAQVLIDALEDEDEEIRQAAAWGLQRMTGLGYPATPAPWRAWWEEEQRWNEFERDRLRDDLAAGDAGVVCAALREYAGRRAWREDLAEDVLIAVRRPEPGLRIAAIGVLENLHAVSAIGPIAALLDAPDAGVRDAVRRTLGSISGLDLPEDPESAMALLNLL